MSNNGVTKSIWWEEGKPFDARPATKDELDMLSRRLGVRVPHALELQLKVQGYGNLWDGWSVAPFSDRSEEWTAAVADGIMPLSEWHPARSDDWLQGYFSETDANLIVVIAGHSESLLCLDYRSSGPKGEPSLVYINAALAAPSVLTVAGTLDEFVDVFLTEKYGR